MASFSPLTVEIEFYAKEYGIGGGGCVVELMRYI
jgi:hypothetical protein